MVEGRLGSRQPKPKLIGPLAHTSWPQVPKAFVTFLLQVFYFLDSPIPYPSLAYFFSYFLPVLKCFSFCILPFHACLTFGASLRRINLLAVSSQVDVFHVIVVLQAPRWPLLALKIYLNYIYI